LEVNIGLRYIIGPILQAYPFCDNSTPEKKKKRYIIVELEIYWQCLNKMTEHIRHIISNQAIFYPFGSLPVNERL
jgi:hypothetical protein